LLPSLSTIGRVADAENWESFQVVW
jgi:hypothetical protein